MKGFQEAKIFSSLLSATLVALAVGGCGGSSNTLPEPTSTDGTQGVALRPCTGKCLSINVAFEPVKNLNYTCGETVNVTSIASGAQCPVSSTMSLFLQGKNGGKKIELGERFIPQFGLGEADDLSAYFLRLTPLDFTDTGNGVKSVDDAGATKALNIIRFLDAFRVKSKKTTDGQVATDADDNVLYERVSYNSFAPINQLDIPDDIKATMDTFLEDDVVLSDFETDAFIDKTKTWLAHHGLAVVLSKEQAKPRLEKMLNTSMSTLYQSFPNIVTSGFQGTSTDGTVGNNPVEMQQYVLINRDNTPIGQGAYWQLSGAADAQDKVAIRQQTRFSKMRFLNSSTPSINPFTNELNDYRWQVFGGSDATSPVIDFYQGTLIRDFGIFGSEFIYAQNTGQNLNNDALLGKWRVSDGFGQTGEGKFTMTRVNNARQDTSPFLDPEVWVGQHGVEVGERYVFPLHLTLDFTYGNGTADCGNSGCRFDNGKLGITILENGNIVTDGSSVTSSGFVIGEPNCTADEDETPIGVVRASSQNTYDGVPGMFINPGIVLSGAQFGELDGVQIGTQVLDGSRIVFNVKQLVDNANAGISALGNVNANAEQGSSLTSAVWSNAYNILLSQYITKQKADGNTSSYTDADEERVYKKSDGRFTIQPSSCYELKVR